MKLLIHSQTSMAAPLKFWEWISNFMPHFIADVITYPCHDQRGPRGMRGQNDMELKWDAATLLAVRDKELVFTWQVESWGLWQKWPYHLKYHEILPCWHCTNHNIIGVTNYWFDLMINNLSKFYPLLDKRSDIIVYTSPWSLQVSIAEDWPL